LQALDSFQLIACDSGATSGRLHPTLPTAILHPHAPRVPGALRCGESSPLGMKANATAPNGLH